MAMILCWYKKFCVILAECGRTLSCCKIWFLWRRKNGTISGLTPFLWPRPTFWQIMGHKRWLKPIPPHIITHGPTQPLTNSAPLTPTFVLVINAKSAFIGEENCTPISMTWVWTHWSRARRWYCVWMGSLAGRLFPRFLPVTRRRSLTAGGYQ